MRGRRCVKILGVAVAIMAVVCLPVTPLFAASGTWNYDGSDNWTTTSRWSTGAAPGTTSGTSNTDTATFSTALTADRVITVDTYRNIQNISFGNTSAYGYTLYTGTLHLTSGGVVQTLSGNGAHTDVILSPIVLEGNGGTYTFTAGATSASSLLYIKGGVTGVATTGNTTTLTLNGSNTGINSIYEGVIGDGANGGKVAVLLAEMVFSG